MSFFETMLGLIIIIGLYILISEYYVKRRLKIKRSQIGLFSKGRKKVFVLIEITLLILLLISLKYFSSSPVLRGFPVPIFFFFMFLVRGIEEWVVRKSEKGYYHEWLAAATMLVVMIFVALGEMLKQSSP